MATVKTNNIFDAKYIIDSCNYTKKQMKYLYLDFNDIDNFKEHELDNLIDKCIEKYDDWYNAEKLIHKWNKWKHECNKTRLVSD